MVYLLKLVSSGLVNRTHHHLRVSSLFFCSNTLNNPSSSSSGTLFGRVQLIRDPKASVVPVLSEWISEGRPVSKSQLGWLARTLKDFRRYHHALQVSMWMTDNRCMEISSRDMAIRLELIHKVQGLEPTEYFFNSVSKKIRTRQLYSALLNCYVSDNCTEKAESLMTEMRDNGLADTSFPYNVLVNLYSKNGEFNKIEQLMQEMEQKGIARDKFTLRNLLSSYVTESDASKVDNLLRKAEETENPVADWKLYSIAADGYLKLGMKEKALEVLRKLELKANKMKSWKKKTLYKYLICLYASAGERGKILNIWDTCEFPNVHKDALYASVITSLAKLSDIEGAEMIFMEWESHRTTYDFRVVDALITGYCQKGLLSKAESLIKRAKEEGRSPYASSWNMLATGYAEQEQFPKAIEMLKNGILVGRANVSPNYVTLGKCLDYLKEHGDVSVIEEILDKLKDSGVLADDAYLRLMSTCNASGESFSRLLCEMYAHSGKTPKMDVEFGSDGEEPDEISRGA